jgi:TonB dependent receptor
MLEFRFAALRSSKRALIANQTIEPTQLAGFNQFFDDFNNDTSRRYGVGLDVTPVRELHVGIELSRRQVAAESAAEDRTERLSHAYLWWAPRTNWSVGAEVLHDRFALDSPPVNGTVPNQIVPAVVSSTRVPLTLRYFAPGGLFMQIGATRIEQRVERTATPGFGQGRTRFTLVDLAIGYRFPGRKAMLALEGRNLTNRKFSFQDDNYRSAEPVSSSISPTRSLFLRATVNF